MKKKVKKLSVTKRIKADEKQIVLGIAFVIIVLVALVICFVFSALNGENIPGIKSGPLYIEFSDNEDGMSDIVNFTEENIPDDEVGYTIYSTSFKVTNTKSGSSWYAIYLDDYVDAIKYVAENNCIPVCDMYRTLGWNKWNFSQYFNDGDGVHPFKGFKQIAERMQSFILSNL